LESVLKSSASGF